jgi:hypothetical protein
MNPTQFTSAPPVQHLNFNPSAGAQSPQSSGVVAAARQQASQIFESEGMNVSKEIVSKCNAIENEMFRGVPVATRMALGDFLVSRRLVNPGDLTTRQENLCAWVMLEHTALNPNQKLSFNQLQSFAKKPAQLDIATKIASQLSLTQERFTR